MCVTNRYDMTLAVKVALNPSTTNQPIQNKSISKKEINVTQMLKICIQKWEGGGVENFMEKGKTTGYQPVFVFLHNTFKTLLLGF